MVENTMLAEERIKDRGAIPGGINVRKIRTAVVVDENRLLRGDGCSAKEVTRDRDADRGDDEVTRDGLRRRKHHALYASVAFESQRPLAGMNGYPVVLQ